MATMDTFGAAEQSRERASSRSASWLAEAATWFALAIAGMLVVFAGLIVDGYQHNNGAGEESLISLTNPGHLIAGVGLLVTSVAALLGLSVSMLKNLTTAEHAVRRFVPVTAAWVSVAAIGIGAVTYLVASDVTVGHGGHSDSLVAADQHGGEEAGIVKALEDQGLLDDGTDPSKVEGALTQGASGHPSGKHDHGQHATFTQVSTLPSDELMPMLPEGLISAEQIPAFKDQVLAAREVAQDLDTTEKAVAAGFFQATGDVPFMGEHWLNSTYLTDGVFDPSKPEGLLFSTIDGEKKLVGVWFLQLPGIGGVKRDVEPAGFTGDLDLWHAHIGLCIVALSGASEGETRESCEAKGGKFTADLRWMMHVWVTPETSENPAGVFAYLNNDLFEKQQAQKVGGGESPSGTVGD
jgi:hypothetical protein